MRASTNRLAHWQWLHRWSSLVCTVLLLASCLTGLPLVFSDELAADHAKSSLAGPPLQVTPGDLDVMAHAAAARYPAQRLRFIFFDQDEGRIKLVMGPGDVSDRSHDHALVFDAVSGVLVDEPPAIAARVDEWMPWLRRLHTELLSGFTGEMVLAGTGLLALMALVSGVVVYGPYMKKLAFGELRHGRRRVWWIDLHNLLGIVTALWLAVVVVTGVMNEFAKPLAATWRIQQATRLAAPDGAVLELSQLASIQGAYDAARKALPTNNITSIILPSRSFNNARHYLIWANGDTPLTHRLFSALLVDARSNGTAAVAAMPVWLRILQLSRPLHFGDYGGMPLKGLWALLDLMAIAVLTSGVYLWWRRHPGR